MRCRLHRRRHLATVGRPLPSLQQVDFGTITMGWLDLAAPALLGLLVTRRGRAAAATGLAAGAWGLLLIVTSPIAATPPVLAGLAAGRQRRGRTPRKTADVLPFASRDEALAPLRAVSARRTRE